MGYLFFFFFYRFWGEKTKFNFFLFYLNNCKLLLLLLKQLIKSTGQVQGLSTLPFTGRSKAVSLTYNNDGPSPLPVYNACVSHRYYAIAAPLHYGTLVNSRKIMLGLCGTWIVCLLISMPPVFRLAPYTYQPGLPVCTADFGRGRATIIYSIFYTTITLVLPGVIILGCNIKASDTFVKLAFLSGF